ncbi:MAG: ParA family protein [Proteobacteria bacterium]|nr:ParA family protein [Pseudomonadota bacterium]
MRVWCALNQKGGVGKTTLLLLLLIIAWTRLKRVCLLDLDPQRSAEKWWGLRADKTDNTLPVIHWGMAGKLRDMLETAEKQRVKLAFVDTAGSIDRPLARAAAEAHLIIIPTRTSMLDVQSLEDTLGYLEDVKAIDKAVIVINQMKPSDDPHAVNAVAKRFKVPVAAVLLRDRAQYAQAIDEGQGITKKSMRSLAAREIEKLFDWLLERDAEIQKRAQKKVHA